MFPSTINVTAKSPFRIQPVESLLLLGGPDVKRSHDFHKKGGSGSQEQLVWKESSIWQVDGEGLQLTQTPSQCYGDEKHCLEGEKQ